MVALRMRNSSETTARVRRKDRAAIRRFRSWGPPRAVSISSGARSEYLGGEGWFGFTRILRILAMSKAFAALPDTGFERFGNFRDNLTSGEVIPERADYFQICKPSVAIGA